MSDEVVGSARRRRSSRGGRRPDRRLVAAAVVLVLVALATLGVDLIGGGANPAVQVSDPAAAPPPSASASAVGPSSSRAPSSGPASAPGASAGSTRSPTPTGGGPAPAGAPADIAAAPSSARGFRPEATVVAMGLPFRAGTQFAYGDGFRRPRDGVVYPYNLIRGVAADGTLLRAHDGQDLLVPIGTLVIAPFAGVVVDPSATWRPWDPQRYGRVIAIRSTEPTSPGYVVILVHLSRQSVAIGATVRRGQVVGRTGRSGNAGETLPQLHVEIRAPFLIRYGYGGVIRRLDVFDIGPSLRAAAANGG